MERDIKLFNLLSEREWEQVFISCEL